MEGVSTFPPVRAVLLLLIVLYVHSVRSYSYYRSYRYYSSYRYYRYSYSYRSYRTYYYYYYSSSSSSNSTPTSATATGIAIGVLIAVLIIIGAMVFFCYHYFKNRRAQRSGRVIQTNNVTSIPPAGTIQSGGANPNVVAYTTEAGNIAYAPSLAPPKYETVVTNGSADISGQKNGQPGQGQPPPYPSAGMETNGQHDEHVTHDTANLVKD